MYGFMNKKGQSFPGLHSLCRIKYGNRKLCLIVQYTGSSGSWGAKAVVYEFLNGMSVP